jgi:hypothetical protein
MHYDASGTDYISTPSFAIPNTGILTIEVWMKSTFYAGVSQSIVADFGLSATVGHILVRRSANTNELDYYYTDGSTQRYANFDNLFQYLDNQWIHIVVVADYTNKTIKAYRNGVQFDVTKNLTTPVFPTTNNIKYIGSYSSTL